MRKRAVIRQKDFDLELKRRVDPLSEVSSSFRAMHSRVGAEVPHALKPSAAEIKSAKARRSLSKKRKNDIVAEINGLLGRRS
jgi:hypothetical protein